MDSISKYRGIQYERLLLRAYQLTNPSTELGADKRIYYLLYYIKAGVDLRETGYIRQFLEIKENVLQALQKMRSIELHQHERIGIERLLQELLHIFDEDALALVIDRALKVTGRLEKQDESQE